jgi:hypothetical protein
MALVLPIVRSHAQFEDSIGSIDAPLEGLSIPTNAADLLSRGLGDYRPDSLAWWEDCHDEMTENNPGFRTEANVAMALIFARAGKYDDMRRLLQSTRTDAGGELMILRLLSWAQASDFMVAEACMTTQMMLDLMMDNLSLISTADKVTCLKHSGQLFGFAATCGSIVQDQVDEQVQSARSHALRRMHAYPKAVAIFRESEDRIAGEVAERFESLLAAQSIVREEQIAEKQQVKEQLNEDLTEIADSRRGALDAVAQIQSQLLEAVAALDQAVAPVRSAESSYSSELSELENAKSRLKTEAGKEVMEPFIARVRGRLNSVRSDILSYEASVRQLEVRASARLAELGGHLDWLDRNETADRIRLRLNELKSETGKTKGIAAQLRINGKLSSYAPLDFDIEEDRFHQIEWRSPDPRAGPGVADELISLPSLE